MRQKRGQKKGQKRLFKGVLNIVYYIMTSNNKYASSSIYKVVDNAYTMCYYGSTTQQLSMRMTKHRMHYKLFAEGKSKGRFSVFDIFDAHGVENCKIELVEECPCESIEQLNKREGFYIQNNECVNKHIPGRTLSEWKSANPDKVKEAQKKFRTSHNEQIKEQRSEKVVCDICGAVISRHALARHNRSGKHMAAETNKHDDSSEDERQVKAKKKLRQPHEQEEEKAPQVIV